MKVIIGLFALVALSQAIDLSQVKPRVVYPKINADIAKGLAQNRIVGGEEAQAHAIPYQVGMLIDVGADTFFCGGSLISQKYVLTAAHCVEGASHIEVRLGAHRINDAEDSQTRVSTTSYLVHPGWDLQTLLHDIALVELEQEVDLNDHVKTVKLPSYTDAGNSFSGQTARVSGWGKDSDAATGISAVLREVFVEIITNFVCNISFLGQIHDTQICTGGAGGVGSCSGDSGGPLVIGNKQVGIVSFGLAVGCEVGWPSAFTRVTSYLDWIQDHSDVVIEH